MEAGGSSQGRRRNDQNRGWSDAGQESVESECPLKAGKGKGEWIFPLEPPEGTQPCQPVLDF